MSDFWYFAKIFMMIVMIVTALGSLALFASVVLSLRNDYPETEEVGPEYDE